MEVAGDREDDLLVLRVEAREPPPWRVRARRRRPPRAPEIEQQPLEAERGMDEVCVGREDPAGNDGRRIGIGTWATAPVAAAVRAG